MKKISFDSGIEEFQINGTGVLRFNPSDPNVYERFYNAIEQIRAIEQELIGKGQCIADTEDKGVAVLRIMKDADAKVKNVLNHVFGEDNDFDKMLGGVNLLAVAGNGERVITNLLNALLPIVEQGAKRCVDGQVKGAVQRAQGNRAQRRAKK